MTPLLQILALMHQGRWDEAHSQVQLDDSSVSLCPLNSGNRY